VASTSAQSNTAAEINSRVTTFAADIGAGLFYFKALLNSSGTQQVELEGVTVEYVH